MLNQNNMPGAGSITDTMDFMRKMWGSMGAPAMGIPSLSVEEINKKITDLKTVASWLELNMNMLRATIQTLEVQSATLSTLQAMGAILTPGQTPEHGKAAAAPTSPFGFANWPEPAAKAAAAQPQPVPEPRVEDMEDLEEGVEYDAKASASEPAAAASGTAAPGDMPGPDLQAAMSNPNAWWNLLQEQFQQAVGNVLAEQEVPVKKTGKTTAKPKPAAAKAATPKKTTKAAATGKPGTRAKSTTVQSPPSKSVSRKPKSP
jgi:hypothetical protein